MEIGRLLFPALRWDPDRGFASEEDRIERALRLGVGGFILFGGNADSVRELTDELRRRAPATLLIGADLERGAGQQFHGATALPPCAALGWLGDPRLSREAGRITAASARALGVNWVYAPVADVDIEPRNPIVGTRAFGDDPGAVADHVSAWIDGCRAGGALSCAKHFPGHGRTLADSHLALPRVDASTQELERDLLPFRRAVGAGVDSVMTAHVAYPALDASDSPATLSSPIIDGLLRNGLGYDGVVVTDALIMEGVLEGAAGEGQAAVRALAAGCDALLYPADPEEVVGAVADAVGRELRSDRIAEAIRRLDDAAHRVAEPPDPPERRWADAHDVAWAREVAQQSLHAARGRPAGVRGPMDVLTIDDDAGGPFPPGPRDTFPATLRAAGADVREVDSGAPERSLVVAVYSDIRGWKGRPGLSAAAVGAAERALAVRPDATVVLFGHPRLAAELPGGDVLVAWGGEPLMQEAAARWLTGGQRDR